MVMHVQTELDEGLYKELKKIAIMRRKSLKEVVREAIARYVAENKREVEDRIEKDSIWKAVGVFEAEEDTSERDDWGCVDWQSE